MFFVVVEVVFMHMQSPDTKFGPFIWRPCRLLIYGVLSRSMNVSAMITDIGNPQYFE